MNLHVHAVYSEFFGKLQGLSSTLSVVSYSADALTTDFNTTRHEGQMQQDAYILNELCCWLRPDFDVNLKVQQTTL